jgi:hypothetical protein
MKLRHTCLSVAGCILLVTPFVTSVNAGARDLAAQRMLAGAKRNLILNGGFESPVVSPGTYQLFTPGQNIPGWNIVGPSGSNTALMSGSFTQNGFQLQQQTGKQYEDVTGTSDLINHNLAGVAQTVATVPGTRYTLSFWVGNVVNPGGIFGTKSTVEVTVNGRRVLLATNTSGAGSMSVSWQQFHLTFKAVRRRTTLAFLNYDPAPDTANGLDSISLVRA